MSRLRQFSLVAAPYIAAYALVYVVMRMKPFELPPLAIWKFPTGLVAGVCSFLGSAASHGIWLKRKKRIEFSFPVLSLVGFILVLFLYNSFVVNRAVPVDATKAYDLRAAALFCSAYFLFSFGASYAVRATTKNLATK